jgi:spermidine synthase
MTPDLVRRFRAPLILTFFLSGFCGLLYQVVWVRLAFAAFGVITPVLSVVISVFMLGLAIGSWAAGRQVTGWTRRTGWSAVYFYAICELGIGLGAFLVPRLFDAGQRLLLPIGGMDSGSYLFVSAAVLAVSILPWCVLMGATFPLMMLFVKEIDRSQNSSFSYLYTANVAGAAVGTAVTAIVLIEVLGFVTTLAVAATLNLVIGTIAFAMGRLHPNRDGIGLRDDIEVTAPPSGESKLPTPARMWGVATILFMTGFSPLAL